MLTEEYYDILEKYGNHKPIDYLFTQLTEKPSNRAEWALYAVRWIKARLITALIFSHYFLAMAFVGFVFVKLFLAIKVTYPH